MDWKEKIKIGAMSAAGGAIVLAIIGFNWGGWVTGGTAHEMAQEMAETAVVARLVPISVTQFMKDPNREDLLKKMKKIDSWERGEFVQKHGWATMPGEKKPDSQVADECAKRLMKLKI